MEKTYAKVEGHSHLVRDLNTNAIINMDSQEYNSYLSLRNIKRNQIGRIDKIENNLNELKSDINEIKFLLQKLTNGS
jgi:hypothetical protein